MGFQTNISILNDHLDWIEKNPKTFVKAIKYEMNYGTESPMREVLARNRAKRQGEEFYSQWGHETDEGRQARSHYVTVHQARHADELQVIVSQYNSSWPVHEIPYAIEKGWLELKSNPETYVKILRGVARQLVDQAHTLDEALNKYEADHAESV